MSYLGVKKSMPHYLQKSIILYNQIIRVTFLVLFAVFAGLFFYFKIKTSLLFFIPIMLIIIISLLFNSKGKIKISLFLYASTLPVLLLFFSVYSKLNNQGTYLIFYIAPRLGILILSLIPATIGGFKNNVSGIISASIGILVYLLFDTVHHYFGIYGENYPYLSSNFWILKYGLLGFTGIIILLIFFLQGINSNYETQIKKQTEEITAQRDALQEQKDIIEKQNIKINESINYGKRIQTAILPPPESLAKDLSKYFLFFKPKDGVSGDFYWKRRIGNRLYLSVADCTGHGVPGAFLSMLNLGFLNEIVNRYSSQNKDTTSAEILDEVRELIKKSLRQEKSNSSREGMDIGLCIIDLNKKILNYSGANFELIYFINNELIERKGNRQPVGIHRKEVNFENHFIDYKKVDIFYLFSDGFIDQIGGEKKSKYKRKNFKLLLSELYAEPPEVQFLKISQELSKWQMEYPQVDDITILGFIP